MRRIKDIFNKIIDFNNLVLAEKKARKGKTKTYGVRRFDKDPYNKLLKLQKLLVEGKYKTSKYDIFTIVTDREKKEREIYRLPYYPDRIVHHAIMNVIESILINRFTTDTYSCIKGRGIHSCVKKLKKDLKDAEETKYCLKMDIRKYFPHVNQDILYNQFKRIFKDRRFLALIKEIIYSVDKGIPIGNYISQFAANLYLTQFDRWIKQDKHIKYYYRYCDDIVILSNSKKELHTLVHEIKEYLNQNLQLEIKNNWQVFPVESRGLDFLGYNIKHSKTFLRKDMKKRFYLKCKYKSKNNIVKSLSSYWGWCKYGNCHTLWFSFTKANSYKNYV